MAALFIYCLIGFCLFSPINRTLTGRSNVLTDLFWLHSSFRQVDIFDTTFNDYFPPLNGTLNRGSLPVQSSRLTCFLTDVVPASTFLHLHQVMLWARPRMGVPFRPRYSSCRSACFLSLLLILSGDVQLNPGPPEALRSLTVGTLNICSAINKTASIHDTIADFSIDLLALSETRIQHDHHPAIKDSVAPHGFNVLHVHRQPSAAHPTGGGLCLIYRDTLVVRPQKIMSYMTFEYQSVQVTSTCPSLTVINIYRPPQTSIVQFCVELNDLLSSYVTSTDRLIVCGDLNCSGQDSASIDDNLAEVFDSLGFIQHVNLPTRDNNLLDVFATDSSLSVSKVRVDDASCVSDHRLVVASVSTVVRVNRAVPLSARRIKNIDPVQFEQELRCSSIFTSPADTVDDFTHQIKSVVVTLLDKYAPLRRCRRRPSKPISRWLSQEAITAKRHRRRLERRWQRSQQDTDRVAYRSACRRANKLINSSRQAFYREQFSTLSACNDRWRLAKQLLHSGHTPQNRTEVENNNLCSAFSSFFADKISKLKQAVATEVSTQKFPAFSDPQFSGSFFDTIHTVSPAQVKKIIPRWILFQLLSSNPVTQSFLKLSPF